MILSLSDEYRINILGIYTTHIAYVRQSYFPGKHFLCTLLSKLRGLSTHSITTPHLATLNLAHFQLEHGSDAKKTYYNR